MDFPWDVNVGNWFHKRHLPVETVRLGPGTAQSMWWLGYGLETDESCVDFQQDQNVALFLRGSRSALGPTQFPYQGVQMVNGRGLKLTTLPFASLACRGTTLLWSHVDGSLAVIISEAVLISVMWDSVWCDLSPFSYNQRQRLWITLRCISQQVYAANTCFSKCQWDKFFP